MNELALLIPKVAVVRDHRQRCRYSRMIVSLKLAVGGLDTGLVEIALTYRFTKTFDRFGKINLVVVGGRDNLRKARLALAMPTPRPTDRVNDALVGDVAAYQLRCQSAGFIEQFVLGLC
jgi:hypothetical protein